MSEKSEKAPLRKPRTARTTASSDATVELGASVRTLKRKVEESLDQLSLIQGVLEELCERQEALATWQMEYAKRTLSLGEAQWQTLREMTRRAQAGLSTAGARLKDTKEGFADSLEEATEYLGDLSGELSRRREVRRRVMDDRAATRLGKARAEDESAGLPTEDEAEWESQAAADAAETEGGVTESILVLPEKTDFH